MKLALKTSQTFYQDIGKSHNILVMLHGWGGDWQSFSNLIPELSKDFRLIIPDLPAFALSTINNDEVWKSQDYVLWLYDFLQALNIKKANLLGHSFGGKIVALFTAAHPEKVDKLILLSAAGLPEPLNSRQLLQQKLLALIPPFVKLALPYKWRLKLLKRFSLSTDHLNSSPLQRQILRYSVQENIANSLQMISRKTLLIWGDSDNETPIEQGLQFKELIKNSKLSVIEGADHFAFFSHRDQIIKDIRQFVL